MSDTPSILAPQPHVIRLAGREYKVGPYPMRRVRELCVPLEPLYERMQAAEGHPLRAIAAANDVLDFFYTISSEMAKDRDVLDEASETEITEAIAGFFGYLFAPLAKRAAGAASDALPEQATEASETKSASSS